MIDDILAFRCPKWQDLPQESLFNRQVVEYINTILKPLFHTEVPITSTMIQNYSKWDCIPQITGRKYHREQIAILIIIVILKQILNIDDVKKGVILQLKLMPIEAGYDEFAASLDQALHRTFQPIQGQEQIQMASQHFEASNVGIHVLSNAYALKILGKLIIENNGYQNLGEKK